MINTCYAILQHSNTKVCFIYGSLLMVQVDMALMSRQAGSWKTSLKQQVAPQ